MDQSKKSIPFKGQSKTSRFKWHINVLVEVKRLIQRHGGRVWPRKKKVMERLLFHSARERGHRPIVKLYDMHVRKSFVAKHRGFLPPQRGQIWATIGRNCFKVTMLLSPYSRRIGAIRAVA